MNDVKEARVILLLWCIRHFKNCLDLIWAMAELGNLGLFVKIVFTSAAFSVSCYLIKCVCFLLRPPPQKKKKFYVYRLKHLSVFRDIIVKNKTKRQGEKMTEGFTAVIS